MKPTRDKNKYAPYPKSTSQSNHSNASVKGCGEYTSHGSAGKSSKRAGAESHERGGYGGEDEHTTHSPISIQEALKGTSCPARKQALVKTAQADDTVDSTLETLRDMPDNEYDASAAVSKAVNNEK